MTNSESILHVKVIISQVSELREEKKIGYKILLMMIEANESLGAFLLFCIMSEPFILSWILHSKSPLGNLAAAVCEKKLSAVGAR